MNIIKRNRRGVKSAAVSLCYLNYFRVQVRELYVFIRYFAAVIEFVKSELEISVVSACQPTVSLNTTVFKFEQSLKAYVFMVVTLLGITIFCKPVQPLKALAPMLVTFLLIVMLVRLVQL